MDGRNLLEELILSTQRPHCAGTEECSSSDDDSDYENLLMGIGVDEKHQSKEEDNHKRKRGRQIGHIGVVECFLCQSREALKQHESPSSSRSNLSSPSPADHPAATFFPMDSVDVPAEVPQSFYEWWRINDRPSCDECGLTATACHDGMSVEEQQEVHTWHKDHKGARFFRCGAVTYRACYPKLDILHIKKSVFTAKCHRTVCSSCINKGHHLREQSIFNHDHPQWRAHLFGCCASPRIVANTAMCYYCCDHRSSMWEGTLDTFTQHRVEAYALATPKQTVLLGVLAPIFCWLYPLVTIPLDLGCCSVSRIRDHEREVRARFGVAEHSTAEMVFCRHCVYMRLQREAEARGHPQPTCCTQTYDVPNLFATSSRSTSKSSRDDAIHAPAIASLL